MPDRFSAKMEGLFTFVHGLMGRGEYAEVDALLEAHNPSEHRAVLTAGLLRATVAGKGHLKAWDDLLERSRPVVGDRLLGGLF